MKRLWLVLFCVLFVSCSGIQRKDNLFKPDAEKPKVYSKHGLSLFKDYTSVFAKSGLNVDADSNDAMDVTYGGTNAVTAAAARTSLGAYGPGDEDTIIAAVTEIDLATLRDGITGIVIGAGDDIGYSSAVENVDYAGASHASRHAPNGADPVDIWSWGGALTVGDANPPVVPGYLYDCTGGTTITITDFFDSGDDDHSGFTDGDRIGVLMNDGDVTLDCSDNAVMECNANINFTGSSIQVIMVKYVYRNGVWYSPNLTMGFSDPLTFNRGALQLPYSASGDATLTEAYVQQKSDEDAICGHGGATGEVQAEFCISMLEHISFTFDPTGAYAQEDTYRSIPLFVVGDDFPHGFTITEWKVKYVKGDPTTELDADLICDVTPDYNTAAGATVMDVLDTTAGASTADSGFDSVTCANGGFIYIHFGADPVDANVLIAVDIWGYAEED